MSKLADIRKTVMDDVFEVETALKSVSETAQLDEVLLNSYLQSLKAARTKFEEVQETIIESQSAESRKQRETEFLDNFLKRCKELEVKIWTLIERSKTSHHVDVEEAGGFSGAADKPQGDEGKHIKEWMLELMGQMEKKHREDLLKQEKRYHQQLTELRANLKEHSQASTQSFTPGPDFAEIFKATTDRQIQLLEKLSNSKSNSRLPPLDIPKFSGQFSKWISFRDRFVSTVINESSLSKVQKLHYLKGALTGEAASVLENLEVTEDNFEAAWDLLNTRFNKRKNIIMEYVKNFHSVSPVSTATNSNVRKLVNDVVGVIQALDTMKESSRDPWLIHVVLGKLDHESKTLWACECGDKVPTWNEFVQFLYNRCDELDSYSPTAKNITSGGSTSRVNSSKTSTHSHKNSTASLVAASENSCKCCSSGSHPFYECPKFLSQSSDERYSFVRKSNLCRNCLVSKHFTNNCNYRRCRLCDAKHNVLLHERFIAAASGSATPASSVPAAPPAPSTADNPTSPTISTGQVVQHHPTPGSSSNRVVLSTFPCRTSPTNSMVFLATAIVEVLDADGKRIKCRAVLDSGSQTCLISTALSDSLRLKKHPVSVSLTGVGGVQSNIRHQTDVILFSTTSSENFNLACLVVPRVTRNLPSWNVNPEEVNIPPGTMLADPQWFESRPIDILIGGTHYWEMVKDNTLRLGEGQPLLKETSFGFVVVGQWTTQQEENSAVCNISTLASLNKTLRQFWELEEVPEEPTASLEQEAAEKHFEITHSRSSDGRFVVKLPFRSNSQDLGDSRSKALRQYMSLERKFHSNPEFHRLYTSVMDDYIQRKWLETVPPDAVQDYSYYMAQHGVLKDSATTQLRVVYNASEKTSTGLSLNDTLMVGPVVQPDLYTILIRFCRHPYAITTDISKMYPQLILHHPHSDFQRLLWRKTPEDPITDYRMTRVCFGVASSPFLATKAITMLGEEHKQTHPLASQALLNSFYVDDGIISVETCDQAKATCTQLIEVLASGGFTLGKWNSNYPGVLPDNCRPTQQGVDVATTSTKTLGIKWNTKDDVFFFTVSQEDEVNTKRQVASFIAKIFDPLGLIAPVVINAKLHLQGLHQLKGGWDVEVPPEFQASWDRFLHSLDNTESIRVPRWASGIAHAKEVQIHGFCDASLRAFGSAVYLITKNDGETTSHLLTTKSRVAPGEDKSQTIPRLELCGALLLAELVDKIKDILGITAVYLWTDSTVVLSWLYNRALEFKPFVSHRVNKILRLSSSNQWRHVRTAENSADLITRGATTLQISESQLWWNGPSWLTADSKDCPPQFIYSNAVLTSQVTKNMNARSYLEDLVHVHSSLLKCQRIVAYVCRFRKACGKRVPVERGPISSSELDNALKHLIRLEQSSASDGLADAIRKGPVGSSSKWKHVSILFPFIDDSGLIRVGGRLQNSQECFDVKHPVLLPRGRLAELIAIHEHRKLLHAGPLTLLANLRQKFWPIAGRSLVKRVYRSCVICTRARPRPESQLMGSLPASRVTFQRPFCFTGIDYAGPIPIRTFQNRNAAKRNAYLAIFICMTTRAIHIEVVSALSTEAFMAALKRFAARRGTPKVIHSDCGRNFVGASRELKDLMGSPQRSKRNWLLTINTIKSNGAGVRSIKYHLKRTVGTTALTFEELTTVLTQVEAVLNSRPIGLASDNPNEQEILTPGHFLVGSNITSPPDPDLTELNDNQLTRWRLCQQRFQHFANRWRRDYLNTLQQRSKWKVPQKNLQIGQVVLTLDSTSFGEKWILGIVEDLHPGIDGRVRVVTIRTPKGLYRRSVNKLARLFTEDASELSGSNGSARGAYVQNSNESI
ncbi:uncharacterized protein LOC129808477 [Phlebotomus papatasi]|uniref:uncharacterized protein LOC129808477 n=1 Tax=Phlebotomus papatasi TaxID=29031 RepID=UPI002483EABF|nr:uncharacterized protein LOC129808477 [Phlebotomus papatasi]